MLKHATTFRLALAPTILAAFLALGQASGAEVAPLVSASSWPRVTHLADRGPRQYSALRSGTFGGHELEYRTTLSEMLVKGRDGRPASSLFVTAFVAERRPAGAARPVVFLFNGGPGGSSNTLMFGAMGPDRLEAFDSSAMANPHTPVVSNEDAILDVADLVFIDAPETGFGRPLPGSDPSMFRSNDGDAHAFAQAILRWLTDHDRMSGPVYVAGESYGSIRAVLLARDLSAASPRLDLAGLILISQALWYNGPESAGIKHVTDPVRAINSLPDIVALSWYHGLVDNRTRTLEQAVGAARKFSLEELAPAILSGNRLADADRTRVAGRLAALTGVPAESWLAHNLRLDNVRRQLLADRKLALRQFDGRETEPLQGIVKDEDRDWKAAMSGLTAASEGQASNVFQATDLPEYRSIVPDPYGFEKSWTFIAAPAAGPDVILGEQMAANPGLRLMITQGVFDPATPMGETDYLFSQISVPRERMSVAYYGGGHMLYSDDIGRRAFLEDFRAFVTGRPVTARSFPSPAPGTVSKPWNLRAINDDHLRR